MTSPILDSVFNFDNTAKRWRDSSTGRFLANQAIVDEMRVHQTATYATLDSLTRQLYAGQISLANWQLATASELKDAHLAQAIFGAGGRDNMTPNKWGRVGQTLREQYGFLNNFAQAIADGKVSEAQARMRIAMYGDATQQSYWGEFAQTNQEKTFRYVLNISEHCGDCIAREAGNPYTFDTLQGYPGDGSTKCKARDMCTLEAD